MNAEDNLQPLRPALSWPDALLRINELEAELRSLKTRYAELEEQTGETMKKYLVLKDVLEAVDKALHHFPQFSASYIDVKYSENCFREMHAEALKILDQHRAAKP